MKTETTKVIFRRWKELREVFALFPAIPGTNDPSTCLCYAHMGQHSNANYDACIKRSRHVFSRNPEVASLRRELERAGYVLKIGKVCSPSDYRKRCIQIITSAIK